MKIISETIRECECTLADGTKIYLKPFIQSVRKLPRKTGRPNYRIDVGTTFEVSHALPKQGRLPKRGKS